MEVFFVADVAVASADCLPPGAIRQHARCGLEEVPVDPFYVLGFAATRESQEHFLGEILGVAFEMRSASREEAIECAAVSHCQYFNKRLLALGHARCGLSACPPLACHALVSPTRARLCESQIGINS